MNYPHGVRSDRRVATDATLEIMPVNERKSTRILLSLKQSKKLNNEAWIKHRIWAAFKSAIGQKLKNKLK